jgi:hypothetical protein
MCEGQASRQKHVSRVPCAKPYLEPLPALRGPSRVFRPYVAVRSQGAPGQSKVTASCPLWIIGQARIPSVWRQWMRARCSELALCMAAAHS